MFSMRKIKAFFKKNLVFILIFLIALTVRIYLFFHTYIIGKDSTLYLYQAMAIYSGNLNLLKICSFSDRITRINLFSLAIIPFYYLSGDWEIAGKLLSLNSSLFSLILLYFILKKYFVGVPLYLTFLIYALNPVIVKESAEIMRESFFTFLVLLGILNFIKALNSSLQMKILFFLLSNLFWLLSAWVRVEGILFIPFSAIYLFIKTLFSQNKKLSSIELFLFLILPFILIISFIIYIGFYKNFLFTELKMKTAFINPFTQPIAQELKKFPYMNLPSPTPYFWDMVKQNLWLIALGTTLFYKFIPALHFSNLLFLIAGLKGFKNLIKKDFSLIYFILLSFFYFLVLWFFTFTKWYMEKRYMLPLIYLLSPLISNGIVNILNYLENQFKLSHKKSIFILSFFIIFFSSFKLFEPVRKELLSLKMLSKEIVQSLPSDSFITCSKNACTNLIFTREGRIFFYISNLIKYPLCPKIENRIFYFNLKNWEDYQILEYLKSKGYKVAILEQKVFNERTDNLKKLLEAHNIKTFILK